MIYYHVDGYSESANTFFEYNGCFHHGHDKFYDWKEVKQTKQSRDNTFAVDQYSRVVEAAKYPRPMQPS